MCLLLIGKGLAIAAVINGFECRHRQQGQAIGPGEAVNDGSEPVQQHQAAGDEPGGDDALSGQQSRRGIIEIANPPLPTVPGDPGTIFEVDPLPPEPMLEVDA